MQPWKISIGLTAIILAVALMLAGESFAYLKPYLGIIATDYWLPVAWYGGLAVVTLMVMIYSAARALGLADMGLKVDLMERSIRRGEGGQIELAEKTGNNRTGGQFSPEPDAQQPNRHGGKHEHQKLNHLEARSAAGEHPCTIGGRTHGAGNEPLAASD